MERTVPACHRCLSPDLDAIHRIWPPSTGSGRPPLDSIGSSSQDAGCRPSERSEPAGRVGPVMATRRLGARPLELEEGLRVATYVGGGARASCVERQGPKSSGEGAAATLSGVERHSA
jgi:hypothetical protein